MSHFKLTDEVVDLGYVKLHRIEATVDIPARGVAKGEKGGFVEKESNLSGDAWVYGNAQVSGNARVSGNAQVDSTGAILALAIGGFYTVTLTRKWLFAGCKQLERKEALKLSKKQAVALGCRPELYAPLRDMVRAGWKIVKEKP